MLYKAYLFHFISFSRESFASNTDEWEQYYNAKEPHKTPMIEPWNSKLDMFRKMMVQRCIRPDKVRCLHLNIIRNIYS